jgi:hypothetical protein
MTTSLCLNCGVLKQGAWCPCPHCHSEPVDTELAVLLSDHTLPEDDLRRIGLAIIELRQTGLDEETRCHALAYFLSRKWPSLLEFDISAAEEPLQRTLDTLYRQFLATLPGEEHAPSRISPLVERRWTRAMGADMQRQDDDWQERVPDTLLIVLPVARSVIKLHRDMGEGDWLNRLRHFLQTPIKGYDIPLLLRRERQCVDEAKEADRLVNRFCSELKNGWSDRTKEQAAYFRGACMRLVEMAEITKELVEHTAGINKLIHLEVQRLRQQFTQKQGHFWPLMCVVLDPTGLKCDGTCHVSKFGTWAMEDLERRRRAGTTDCTQLRNH